LKDDVRRWPRRVLKDEERIIRKLGTEVGLSRDEVAYSMRLIFNDPAEASTGRELAETLIRRGWSLCQRMTRESCPFIHG
jgi:hypothetical protein